LVRLLPAPPTQVLDVGRPGHLCRAAGSTAALADAQELAEPDESQHAALLFGPLYHLTRTPQHASKDGEG